MRRWLIAALFLLLAGCAGSEESLKPGLDPDKGEEPMEPAPSSVSEIALYMGDDRQQLLESGAKKEGRLLIYATGTQIEPLIDRFKTKYPYVDVELYRGGSDEIARKTVEEYRANRHDVDAFELSSAGLLIPREHGILQPFHSPELAHYAEDAIEPERHWAVVRESYTGLGFNTNLVAEAEAPKTYRDLLDSKWKGKMAISGSTSTAGNWIGAMLLAEGEDLVRRLGDQDIRVYDMTGRALANLMISGEVMLSPTTYDSHVKASQKEGAPLAWIPLEPVPVTDTVVAVASRAPHPHAALLLVDFLLSKEGQELYADVGYSSARKEMITQENDFKKAYLSARKDYVTEFEGWVRLYQEVLLRK